MLIAMCKCLKLVLWVVSMDLNQAFFRLVCDLSLKAT